MPEEKLKPKHFVCYPDTHHTRPRGIPAHQLLEHRQHDALALMERKQYFIKATPKPSNQVGSETRQEFENLIKKWKKDTSLLAYTAHKTSHPNYLRMAVLGEKALPLILTELEKEPSGSWFPLLEAIAGKDVADDATSIDHAIEKWLDWGRENDLC